MIRSAHVWPRKAAPATPLPDTLLRGPRVHLRFPHPDDWRGWAELRATSRDHLVPFEPQWSEDSLTEPAFRRRMSRNLRDWHNDLSRCFFVFLPDIGIIGGINLNNICRGAAQYASLGYWLGAPYQGHGYMHEAASLVIEYAFADCDLHRVNAATLPHNGRSMKMLRRLGFSEEGFAKSYIQINGTWQDHVLFGLPIESYRAGLDVRA